MPERPLIAVTLGDPSGIGPEIVAKALVSGSLEPVATVVVVGSAEVLKRALVRSGSSLHVERTSVPPSHVPAGTVSVMDEDNVGPAAFPTGRLSAESARAAHAWIERAARLCLAGDVSAMSTAPVNKEAFRLAGISDTGHQEVLKRLSHAEHVATMLVSGKLRCMHLSTHKSLSEACAFVTKENIIGAIRLTHTHFISWGFANPRIGVAALNPHGSDGGLIGREEIDEIAPAVEEAQAAGIDATGPHPADSVFNAAIAGDHDVVVVMYHDQGHIAIKVHGFEQSVSVNLGLPFVRTSVDHGTAFDIAGRDIADETSMIQAVRLASSLALGSGLV